MMHLIISMESGSLNHELLKFLSMIPQFLLALLFINNVPNFPFLHSVTFSRNLTLNSPQKNFAENTILLRVMVLNLTLPEILKMQILSTNQMVNRYPVLIWFTPSLYMRYVLSGTLIQKSSLGVLKMSFKLSAILWIGMPMGGPPFSLLTGDFPVTTFLPMQSKIMLIFNSC